MCLFKIIEKVDFSSLKSLNGNVIVNWLLLPFKEICSNKFLRKFYILITWIYFIMNYGKSIKNYSTVTDFARLRGLSMSSFLFIPVYNANNWRGIISKRG